MTKQCTSMQCTALKLKQSLSSIPCYVRVININSFGVSFRLRTCFAANLFDWPITKKKLKLWKLPNIKIFIQHKNIGVGKYLFNYICSMETILGKTYGVQSEALLGTCWGTHWKLKEHVRNTLWTIKIQNIHQTPTFLKENGFGLGAWVAIPQWPNKNIIPNYVNHIFWPRLMAKAWIVGT
jgi:hypothetical protein